MVPHHFSFISIYLNTPMAFSPSRFPLFWWLPYNHSFRFCLSRSSYSCQFNFFQMILNFGDSDDFITVFYFDFVNDFEWASSKSLLYPIVVYDIRVNLLYFSCKLSNTIDCKVPALTLTSMIRHPLSVESFMVVSWAPFYISFWLMIFLDISTTVNLSFILTTFKSRTPSKIIWTGKLIICSCLIKTGFLI